MHFSTVANALLAAGLASAAQQTVMVGEGGLKYSPDSITAAMGDTIQFVWPGSVPHNVATSDYNAPCKPNNMVASPVMTNSKKMDFIVTVNSTDPMWIFCSVGEHCEEGMAMVVNPPSGGDQTLANYMSSAKNAMSGDPSGTTGGVLVAAGSSSGSSSSAMGSMSTPAASSSMMSGSMSMSTSAASSASTAVASGAAAAPTGQAKAALGAAAAGLLGFAAVL